MSGCSHRVTFRVSATDFVTTGAPFVYVSETVTAKDPAGVPPTGGGGGVIPMSVPPPHDAANTSATGAANRYQRPDKCENHGFRE